jgi:predicted dehydrogenase
MYEAAEKAGVLHYLNHISPDSCHHFCQQLMMRERLENFHWRGTYLQDWITDPNFPTCLQKKYAGRAHYDLNSHSVDLARCLIGEVEAVQHEENVRDRTTVASKDAVHSNPVPQLRNGGNRGRCVIHGR